MSKGHRRIVIVVGAGASKEFGLPTGAELKDKIADICDIRFDDFGSRLVRGDSELVAALRQEVRQDSSHDRSLNHYLHAAWKIRDNMPWAPSIDNFLDTHRNDPEITKFGKLAIAKAILQAEANSALVVDANTASPKLDSRKLQNTWIARLFGMLVAQRSFGGFIEALRSITFVSFNYDRCIHQFFLVASRGYFDLRHDQLDEVLDALNIIYPYGSIGDFRYFGLETCFGQVDLQRSLFEYADSIRTFTEGTGSDIVEGISNALARSDVVVFLGFGFLHLNMKILFGEMRFPDVVVLATGKGLSENSRSQVAQELEYVFPMSSKSNRKKSNVQIIDSTCSELFFEYERFLSG
ncbi:hypothetical protein [Dinoroseobacter sp. S375]|uniref:hypothetical protein n=1 Tax=Dinoroseobacter sp. S375 TaxID=3415136 RepID=UPI003C7C1AB3